MSKPRSQSPHSGKLFRTDEPLLGSLDFTIGYGKLFQRAPPSSRGHPQSVQSWLSNRRKSSGCLPWEDSPAVNSGGAVSPEALPASRAISRTGPIIVRVEEGIAQEKQ